MQVTHVADNVTHAVIGNNKAMDFGISNSAEFFNILSNTLYSDKILAVVREVLCNAWDIHIQTGRTDTPVQVTLSPDNKLTIRDFGTGISNEDIHPIYAVYGNSTKKLDGKQTGGFGLGSKSPFAYVDHFDVTSFYGDKKTIYAVSKSSAEVAGKPSITQLVSVPLAPDEHTGLSVSFNVEQQDRSRFRTIIHMIAKFGEMNVEYNGDKLPTIAFSEAKHGFLITKDVTGIPNGETIKLFVRYGNVVYPMPEHDKIKSLYKSVTGILETIGQRNHYSSVYYKIIFQAKPNTISVTPSRESLSMTDHTVESLKELLTDFMTLVSKDLEKNCLAIEQQTIADIWKNGRPADLVTSNNTLPIFSDGYVTTKEDKIPEILTTVEHMSKSYMGYSYPKFPNFHHQDILMRLAALEKNGFGGKYNRGKLQSFRREFQDIRSTVGSSDWFQRVLVQPLVRKLDAVDELSGSKLLVYGRHHDKSFDKNGRRRQYYDRENAFVEASKLSPRLLEDYMPFLRNFVVISFNRIDVEERLHQFPVMKNELGKSKDMFVYIVSRQDKKVEIVREFFANQGMIVVDLTKRQDWEAQHVVEAPVKTAVVKPRKKGLPKVSELYSGGKMDHIRLRPDSGVYDLLERTEAPEFIFQLNPRSNTAPSLLGGYDSELNALVIKLYGHLGGIVVNDNQRARFTTELKIPALETWFLDRMLVEVLTNPRLLVAFQLRNLKSTLMYHQSVILNTIVYSPELALEFGILNEMTDEDRQIFRLIKPMISENDYSYRVNFRYKQQVIDMQKHVTLVPSTVEMALLADKIKNSKLCGLVDHAQLESIFSLEATKDQKMQRSGALDILQYVLS